MGARAYALKTKTATGAHPQIGIVAADPKLLPMGSRIRVSGAGRYNGIYTVGDTGATIKGHEIDIHVKSPAEARRFGRKRVTVEVLALGKG